MVTWSMRFFIGVVSMILCSGGIVKQLYLINKTLKSLQEDLRGREIYKLKNDPIDNSNREIDVSQDNIQEIR